MRQSAAACALSYEHQPDSWPWRYRATQTFTLDGRALSVAVTLENQSDQAMPFGLGLHPYFPVESATTVQASAAGTCQLDEDGLTVGTIASTRADLDAGLAVARSNLDEVYLDWSGHCRIEWPERHAGMTIECSWPRPNLVIYGPQEAPFVCVEAVTNL